MVLVTLSACSSSSSVTEKKPEETPTFVVDFDAETPTETADAYIGTTLEEATLTAKKNEVPFRVVEQDGQSLSATMDFVIGRINASVENGVVIRYQVEGSETAVETTTQTYDARSWETMIDETCQAYSDGCNTCRRVEGSDFSTCTKMACQQYEKPVCLDEMESGDPVETETTE